MRPPTLYARTPQPARLRCARGLRDRSRPIKRQLSKPLPFQRRAGADPPASKATGTLLLLPRAPRPARPTAKPGSLHRGPILAVFAVHPKTYCETQYQSPIPTFLC